MESNLYTKPKRKNKMKWHPAELHSGRGKEVQHGNATGYSISRNDSDLKLAHTSYIHSQHSGSPVYTETRNKPRTLITHSTHRLSYYLGYTLLHFTCYSSATLLNLYLTLVWPILLSHLESLKPVILLSRGLGSTLCSESHIQMLDSSYTALLYR